MQKNWWNGKAVPGIKKGWNGIKEFVHDARSGKTKTSKLLKEKKSTEIIETGFVEVIKVEITQDTKQRVSPEEYQQQGEQIKILAMLLADRIKKLSNSCADYDKVKEEEYRIQ